MDDKLNRQIKDSIDYYLSPLELKEVELVGLSRGCVDISVNVSDPILNNRGIVHGGILFTLSDTAASLCAATVGKDPVTIQSNINYIKSISQGKITTRARVVHNGRATTVVHVQSFNEDDRLLTDASFTMFNMEDRK